MKKNSLFLLVFCSLFYISASPFSLDIKKDSILLGTGVVLSGTDLLLDNVLKLNRSEYKGEIYSKADVNSLDAFFMQPYSENLDNVSDITLALSMAAPLVLIPSGKSEWLTEAIMYAETLLIANGTKELLKFGIKRMRPYMYFSEKDERSLKNGDFANSFPSGHTTMAFAGATFATYTFFKYFPKSSWRIPVAAGSYSLALTTAVLRMASGKHFLTDVFSGALLGSGIGLLIPFIHTFNENNDLKINIAPNELSFRIEF